MAKTRYRPPALNPASPFQYRKPVRGSLVWWLRLLGIVAFVVVLLNLPATHDSELTRINVRWLGLCMLLTVLQLLLESSVWHWLMSAQHIRHPYPKTLVSYLASQYLGLVTPGHVGEFLAAGYVSMNTGITMGYALSSVVMKKILNWVLVVIFGIWGLPLLENLPFLQGVRKIVWLSLAALLILSLGIGVWVISLRRFAKKWHKLTPWQIDVTEFWSGMRHLLSPQLVFPLILAAGAFSLLFFQLHAVLRALGIDLPLLMAAKIVALSRIAARLVPISGFGVGSKDAALIMLLDQHGVPKPIGFTVLGLWLMCSYLLTLLLSGLAWWMNPLIVRRAKTTRS